LEGEFVVEGFDPGGFDVCQVFWGEFLVGGRETL
jgi:hypothetical protein